MKYERFEDLPVWKAAIAFKLAVDELCNQAAVKRLHNFIDQIDRASLSISNNIAEGFERGTTNELLYFLYVARGSAGECRLMLRYADQRPDLGHLKSSLALLIQQAEGISRQLRGWADSLQSSDIKGQRHLTEQTRNGYDQKRRAMAFADKVRSDNAANLQKMLNDHDALLGNEEHRDDQ